MAPILMAASFFSSQAQFYLFDIESDQLVELASFSTGGFLLNFTIDTSTENYQSKLAATQENNNFYYSGSVIKKISSHSKSEVWQSSALVGDVQRRGLHFRPREDDEQGARMMFSASSIMYQVK